MLADYKAACRRGELRPGRVHVHERNTLFAPRYIFNFPTKRHWRGKSRLEDIESGLDALAREIRDRGVTSVAVPPLGCGNGGLSWKEVRALIEKKLGALEGVRVSLYPPVGALTKDPQRT